MHSKYKIIEERYKVQKALKPQLRINHRAIVIAGSHFA